MADDTEWHTVSNHKHIAPPTTTNQQPKNRRHSKPKIQAKQQQQQLANTKEKKPSGYKKKTGKKKVQQKPKNTEANPFHAAEEDSNGEEEEEEEDTVDPIDLPLPPYHTATFVSCLFDDCESPAPFLDTTSLVTHLKNDHALVFKNLHHMYNSLNAYLQRWAKELEKKSLSELGEAENDGKKK